MTAKSNFLTSKLFLIIIIFISTVLTIFVSLNQKKNIEIITKNKTNQVIEHEEVLPKTICIQNFTEEQFKQLAKALNKEYPKSTVIKKTDSTSVQNLLNQCDELITKNPIETNKLSLIAQQIYIPVTQINTPLHNFDTKKFSKSINERKYKDFTVFWPEELNPAFFSKYNISIGYTSNQNHDLVKQIETVPQENNKKYVLFIPVQKLTLKMKPLEVDYESPFNNNFSKVSYPFKEEIWSTTNSLSKETIKKIVNTTLNIHELEPNKSSTVIVTGKSTLGAGQQSDFSILNSSLSNISEVTTGVDLLILNNSSPITTNCNTQNKNSSYLCSKPGILNELKKLNFSVAVDGAGYHLYDYGKNGVEQSISNYKEIEINYYGIGEEKKSANIPAAINLGNNKLSLHAFNINPVYKKYNASSSSPGIAGSDLIIESIKTIKSDHLVIADIHQSAKLNNKIETYNLLPTRSLIDPAGADLVLCPSSPVIKGMEYYQGKLIFYGLGNFLINNSENTRDREAIIVKLYIYENKVVSYKVIPVKITEDGIINLVNNQNKYQDILNKLYKNSYLWN